MKRSYLVCNEIQLVISSNNVTDFFPALPFNFTTLGKFCKDTWNINSIKPDYTPNRYGGFDVPSDFSGLKYFFYFLFYYFILFYF